MRWSNSFQDAFGLFVIPADFDKVWCFWDYGEDRLGVVDQSMAVSRAFLTDVQVYPTTDEDSVTEDLVKNWGLSIFYEQSFDVIELDYSPHGEIDPEDRLFAIPRPTVGYITYDKEPEDFKLLPQIYEPKEIWHSNRVETLRRRKFLTKNYVTFRDAFYASERDARKDCIIPDYGFHLDEMFYDQLFKKDHITYVPRSGAYYADHWWYVNDLVWSLLFTHPSDVEYALMDELLDTDLPTPRFRSDVVICDIIHEELFTPLDFQSEEFLVYPTQGMSDLPMLYEYEVDPEYDPARVFEDDEFDYILNRYDYYSRLEFIDNRAVFLVEEFIDRVLLDRDEL